MLILSYALNAFIQTFSLPSLILGVLLAGTLFVLGLKRSEWPRSSYVVSAIVFGYSFVIGFSHLLSVGSNPRSDFASFKNQILSVVDGDISALFSSKSPLSIFVYSVFTPFVGTSNFAISTIAVTIFALQGSAVVWALKSAGVHNKLSLIIGLGYGSLPGLALYSPVISSEATMILLIILAMGSAAKVFNGGGMRWIFLFGFLSSLSIYARANSLAILLGFGMVFIIWFALSADFKGFRSKSIGFLTLGASSPIFSFSILHLLVMGKIRLTPYSPSGWQWLLLSGTNRDRSGGYSTEDLELAGWKVVSDEEFKRNALEIAFERITSSPDFIYFALTKKVKRLWSGDGNVANWSLEPKVNYEGFVDFRLDIAGLFPGALLVVLLVSVVIAFGLQRKSTLRSGNQLMLSALTLSFLILAFLHIFIEVQARYHIPFYAISMIYIGVVFSNISSRRRVGLRR